MEREILIEVRDYSSETFEGFVLDRFNRLTQQPDLVPFSLSGTGFSILDQMILPKKNLLKKQQKTWLHFILNI